MNRERWTSLLAAALFAATGCVSCGHEVCKPAFEAGPIAEAPLCDRSHVYVFLINGVTPAGPSGLDGLRMKLAECGYDKTYCVGLCHTGWAPFEMRRVLKCDPLARFILVGYDVGCGAAASLSRHAARNDLPVDAVVLLNPVILPGQAECPQSLVIRSGVAWSNDDPAHCICVASGGHWTLPTQPRTVEAIAQLLKESAAKVQHPEVIDSLPFEYEDAPRRILPGPAPAAAHEWLFLRDEPGMQARPLTPLPITLSEGCVGPIRPLNSESTEKRGLPLPPPKTLPASP